MARDSLAELRTEPFAAEREWTVEDIPVLTASVTVPRPAPAENRVSRRIHRYYQLQCRSYLRYCEHWLLPQAEAAYREALASSAPLPCLRAELKYRVTYNQGGLWSLYTQSRETAASGSALLTRRGDTWDLNGGYPVELSAFFPPRSGWKSTCWTWRRRRFSVRSGRGSPDTTRTGGGRCAGGSTPRTTT